ncbi:hypothetical protein [Dyadobacter sediminis]|uniref:hypothetical protein n=1 Tax=Dyadobacter sediminis TaxID=1493691 RepID=UPI0016636491|nr:hypothetical protein [Dyadobacter sediminis]
MISCLFYFIRLPERGAKLQITPRKPILAHELTFLMELTVAESGFQLNFVSCNLH